jgi:type II secretory pathway component PulK
MPDERGQASVELVAVLPLVLLVGAVAWQLALAGHAAWLTADAARVAARADTVGRDVRVAARSALPRSLQDDLRVRRLRGGGVRVSVRVPLLVPSRLEPRMRLGAQSSLGREK